MVELHESLPFQLPVATDHHRVPGQKGLLEDPHAAKPRPFKQVPDSSDVRLDHHEHQGILAVRARVVDVGDPVEGTITVQVGRSEVDDDTLRLAIDGPHEVELIIALNGIVLVYTHGVNPECSLLMWLPKPVEG